MNVDPAAGASNFEANCLARFIEARPEINLRFGARVEQLRSARELSELELATRMRIPLAQLVELEAGHRSASIVDLERFAQAFGISIPKLLEGL